MSKKKEVPNNKRIPISSLIGNLSRIVSERLKPKLYEIAYDENGYVRWSSFETNLILIKENVRTKDLQQYTSLNFEKKLSNLKINFQITDPKSFTDLRRVGQIFNQELNDPDSLLLLLAYKDFKDTDNKDEEQMSNVADISAGLLDYLLNINSSKYIGRNAEEDVPLITISACIRAYRNRLLQEYLRKTKIPNPIYAQLLDCISNMSKAFPDFQK